MPAEASIEKSAKLPRNLYDLNPGFRGFHPPTSNTTYTPNQFFDVCLPHYSRGVVRLVAYMIRKTLGWCDADGNPQEVEHLISYRTIEQQVGVSRDMIRRTIDEAIAARFIRCIRPGRAKGRGISAESALYELRWDEAGDYTTDPKHFNGFFAGEGNRTYIPNDFFDFTVRHETLSIVRVVGAIVRHTIGFQTKFGFRRQQIEMSFGNLHRRTRLSSRRTLNKAVQTALERNYIVRITEGFFDPAAGAESKATIYGLKWLDTDLQQMIGQKRIPDPDRSEKDTGKSQKRIPEQRSEKDTPIEITPRNKTTEIKQQQAVAGLAVVADSSEILDQLRQEGVHGRTAQRLMRDYPEALIQKQLEALNSKQAIKNRAGWLIRAIEDDYEESRRANGSVQPLGHGATFVAHYYAGYAGNKSAPTAEASTREAEQAQRYVERLLEQWNDESRLPEWGRQFGKEFREKQRFNETGINAFTFALKSHSDEFFRGQASRKQNALQTARNEARAAHRKRFELAWLDHVQDAEQRLRDQDAEAYGEFEENRHEERAALERNAYFKPEQLATQLKHFDSDERRLEDFVDFFAGNEAAPVLYFEDWDEQHNPDSFDEENVSL